MRPQTPLHAHAIRVVNPEAARTPREQVYFDRGNTIFGATRNMGASVHRNYAEAQRPAPQINTQAMFHNRAPIGRTAIAAPANQAPETGVARPVSAEPTLEIDQIHQRINAHALSGAEMNHAFEETNR